MIYENPMLLGVILGLTLKFSFSVDTLNRANTSVWPVERQWHAAYA